MACRADRSAASAVGQLRDGRQLEVAGRGAQLAEDVAAGGLIDEGDGRTMPLARSSTRSYDGTPATSERTWTVVPIV